MFRYRLHTFVAGLLFALALVESSRILVFSPISTKSHTLVFQGVSIALADAGHEVTVVSPREFENHRWPNLKQVVLTGMLDKHIESNQNLTLEKMIMTPLMTLARMAERSIGRLTEALVHPNTRQLMRSSSFDLVIFEMFNTEALVGLGQHFGAPTITLSTYGASQQTNDLVGNPSSLSHVRYSDANYSPKMSLFNRLTNLAFETYEKIVLCYDNIPKQRIVYKTAFPDARVSFDTALQNVSLVFQNTHVTINGPRPYVPNMIEIAGVHFDRQIRPLPEDIKTFLDTATEGVIYFSLGTVLKSNTMKVEKRAVFTKVFATLKQKVIWKFDEAIPDAPSNVMVRQWLPQSDIFQHPNVRLFISHCGQLGSTEAAYAGLPIIGIPFFGDQTRNIEGFVETGWAVRLDYENVTEESLRWALSTVLENKSFAETAKRVSKQYRDQPMTPREATVYWSEYVIRHQGAFHLRSPAMDLNFVQYHNLDVLAIILVGLLSALFTMYLLIWFSWRMLVRIRAASLGESLKKRK